MFTHDDKLEIVNSIINISASTRIHPYQVLREMIFEYRLPEHQAKNLLAECKTIIQGRAKELPWSL